MENQGDSKGKAVMYNTTPPDSPPVFSENSGGSAPNGSDPSMNTLQGSAPPSFRGPGGRNLLNTTLAFSSRTNRSATHLQNGTPLRIGELDEWDSHPDEPDPDRILTPFRIVLGDIRIRLKRGETNLTLSGYILEDIIFDIESPDRESPSVRAMIHDFENHLMENGIGLHSNVTTPVECPIDPGNGEMPSPHPHLALHNFTSSPIGYETGGPSNYWFPNVPNNTADTPRGLLHRPHIMNEFEYHQPTGSETYEGPAYGSHRTLNERSLMYQPRTVASELSRVVEDETLEYREEFEYIEQPVSWEDPQPEFW
ncbi:hypothetical protein GX48_04897 [Paracoccidioides brasiliensis]|nr:hypothetical protein GX48_04897 [Paracoccidioides brasiliensis]